MNTPGAIDQPFLVSVVVVNYNCKRWLERFFPSLRTQTIFDRTEVIIVDNSSKDGSAEICEKEMGTWPNGVFLPTGGNYGFGGGSNRGAKIAHGKYLFFLNPDVWLEPSCLEELVKFTENGETKAGCPLVMDYDSDNPQVVGASGFDLFGCLIPPKPDRSLDRLFAVGTFFFIGRELFQMVGGFDEEFFLYNEEMDLSWRVWMAGESISSIPAAHIHHQGASSGDRAVENRTNDTKRFYANRNQLLVILKNAQFLLLVLVLNQFALVTIEAVVGSLLARRLSFIYWSLLKPMADCWRLRQHVRGQRKINRIFRKHGDFWIGRHFFRLGFGRWMDIKLLFKSGVIIDKSWPATSGK